jgi:hypothetical protein
MGFPIMNAYEASIPPHGATCQSDLCRSVAVVRLTVPPHLFSADGAPSGDITTWDSCDLHWPSFRDVIVRSGHAITDRTGDVRDLAGSEWDVWRSDQGRLYATLVRPDHSGTTVDAYLIGQLRAEMRAVESREGMSCALNA